MKKFFLIAALCFVYMHALAQAGDEQQIKALLAAQTDQWNKGNINGYMKGYWESDSLLFIGSSGPRYGYIPTLERYKQAYPDKAHMGALLSKITSMTRLSDDYYFIVGTWALQREAGNVSGYYTLLFRKINGRWVIVADHSS